MFSPEGKEFTDKVLKHIKFPYDRNAVRPELEEHMEDICDDLTEEGYGRDEAVGSVYGRCGRDRQRAEQGTQSRTWLDMVHIEACGHNCGGVSDNNCRSQRL